MEHFNRTFKESKERLHWYFTVKNTLGYLPVLPDLVKEHNASYHHTISMATNQVNFKNEKEVWDRMYCRYLSKKPQKRSLKVNDSVRLDKKFWHLKKGYLPGWTKELFVVQHVFWCGSHLHDWGVGWIFAQGYLLQTRFTKSEHVQGQFIP